MECVSRIRVRIRTTGALGGSGESEGVGQVRRRGASGRDGLCGSAPSGAVQKRGDAVGSACGAGGGGGFGVDVGRIAGLCEGLEPGVHAVA
eukprot:36098-Pleurochrysis_carterae.AAC.1